MSNRKPYEITVHAQRWMDRVPTPCYLVDLAALRHNLDLLEHVQQQTGCTILLALKGFAMFSVFPLLRRVLHGVCASSPDEARLGRLEFGGEVHAFAAAFSQTDIEDLLTTANCIVFNSFRQWHAYRPLIEAAPRSIHCGLRINPQHSEAKVALYDPCARYSRLGIPRNAFEGQDLNGIDGLHFHTLCEQNADALERTLRAVEDQFGDLIRGMNWINFGGGHHITRKDYNIDLLCELVTSFQQRYGVKVYLEPGEAVALNTGVLVSSVLDVVHNEMDIAILDASANTHMPDVMEMPYRPVIAGGAKPGEKAHSYRLAGLSCLAGDTIGDYAFDQPLEPGARLVFLDMAHYTMVKNTTFNGIRLPAIVTYDPDTDTLSTVRTFGYEDYRSRLS